MRSVRVRLFIFIMLMIPVLVYLGLDEARQTRTVIATPNAAHQQSDYYIIDGRIQDFDESGLLHQRLAATQLEHQPDLQQTLLVNPVLALFDPDHPTKTITSLTGVAADSNELITLAGDVVVQDNPEPDQARILKTQSLLIYPREERAETAEPVTLSTPSDTTTAVGMTIDSASGVVELLSNVKGIHHVN